MTSTRIVTNLGTLMDLRGREVDRHAADMAQKEAVRERFVANLDRLGQLCAGESAQGSLPIALSVNRGEYKQAVLRMMDQHREDMALHEADMAVTRRALVAASHKREVLGQVLSRRKDELRMAQERREQKRQDELASQVWWRNKS